MKITKEWFGFNEDEVCTDRLDWFLEQMEIDGEKMVKKLVDDNKLEWASELLIQLLSHPQQVAYAVFAAEQALHIFEKKYPEDNRPRLAIAAAKNWLENPSDKNRDVAWRAAEGAMAARDDTFSCDQYASWAASSAGWSARVTRAAAWAARDAESAVEAVYAANVGDVKKEIVKYGLTLLTQKIKGEE